MIYSSWYQHIIMMIQSSSYLHHSVLRPIQPPGSLFWRLSHSCRMNVTFGSICSGCSQYTAHQERSTQRKKWLVAHCPVQVVGYWGRLTEWSTDDLGQRHSLKASSWSWSWSSSSSSSWLSSSLPIGDQNHFKNWQKEILRIRKTLSYHHHHPHLLLLSLKLALLQISVSIKTWPIILFSVTIVLLVAPVGLVSYLPIFKPIVGFSLLLSLVITLPHLPTTPILIVGILLIGEIFSVVEAVVFAFFAVLL